MLRWQPSEFWAANITEYTLAVRGFCREKGYDFEKEPMDINTVHELEEMAKRNGKA